MVRSYIRQMAEKTGLPEEVIEDSEPVRNFLKRIVGD